MAYIAPRTWATSELVTAAMMNQDVRDNITAVKAQVDTIYTATFAEPVRAKNVEYQNSTKIRIVTISGTLNSSTFITAFIGVASPAATRVAYLTSADPIHPDTGANSINSCCTFVVPANWYYNTSCSAGIVLLEWIEWDLF